MPDHAEKLREALRVELTHGGIADEVAQVATILGTGHGDPREMGKRLDDARVAFRERAESALREAEQHA